MQRLHADGQARRIGVNNVSATQLVAACESSTVPPAAVQNRCYARTGWDREVRAVCRERGIEYQGFSLLTANRAELAAPEVRSAAVRLGCTVPQLVFAFAHAVGMVALTGTSSRAHMDEDLAAATLRLSPEDVAVLDP